MAFCERIVVEIPNDGAGNAVVGSGAEVDVGQLGGKGYDFKRDAGAAFAGNLEGSVAGQNWTTVIALAASGQGSVADYYTRVRVTVTAPGALGADTVVLAAGRTQG